MKIAPGIPIAVVLMWLVALLVWPTEAVAWLLVMGIMAVILLLWWAMRRVLG